MSEANILETLKKDPKVNPIDRENEILEPLLDEINLIEDANIRGYVRSIMVKAQEFWVIPASFSGNYHPPDERGPGGNVLHTKRVVRIANAMCESYGISLNLMSDYSVETLRDTVIAACLLHDLTKGVVWEEGREANYDKMHPYTVGEFIQKNVVPKDIMAGDIESSTLHLNDEVQGIILSMVRSHMGPWSPVPETMPVTIPSMIVHMADKIASELHYIIDGDDIKEERWLQNNPGEQA